MSRRLTIVVLTIYTGLVAFAVTTREAIARHPLWDLNDVHVGRSADELRQQIGHSRYVLDAFARPRLRWRLARRHAVCWTLRGPTLRQVCRRSRQRVAGQRWLLDVATHRYRRLYVPARPVLAQDWLLRAFLCIHGGEGSWSSNTGNGYHGGLQMDPQFEATYGPEYVARWGDAENWPPSIQILVAERAYRSGRGFGPWPNTSRACGLL